MCIFKKNYYRQFSIFIILNAYIIIRLDEYKKIIFTFPKFQIIYTHIYIYIYVYTHWVAELGFNLNPFKQNY